MKKQVLYREANDATIRCDHSDFVDKLEHIRNSVFLRPRHFGRSLHCSILRYAYDRN